MAEWNAPLPDEAVEGDPTHVEDHNLIVAAIEEARQKVDDIEVPDTSNLATRVYVDNAIAGIDIPPPADLTGLATEAYVDSAVGGIEIPEPVDTSGFATKAELGDYQPAGDYATSAQVSGLAPKQYVDDAVGAIEMPEPVDTSSFATKSEVAAKADAADVEMKITGLNGITGLWAGTQAEYDALPSRDPKVAYIIVEGVPEGQEVGVPTFTSGGTTATSSITPTLPAITNDLWGFVAIVASEQPTQTWPATSGAWTLIFDQSNLDSAYNRSIGVYAAPRGSSAEALGVGTPGLMVAAVSTIRYEPATSAHSGTGGTTDASNVSTRTLSIGTPSVPIGIAVTYYGADITAPDLPTVDTWESGHAGVATSGTGRCLSLHLKIMGETDQPTTAQTYALTPAMGAIPWSRSIALSAKEG